MDSIIRGLREKELPSTPAYLTLDIIIEYALVENRLPTYREIGQTLSKLLNKPKPVSTERVYAYIKELSEHGHLKKEGRRYTLVGAHYGYS